MSAQKIKEQLFDIAEQIRKAKQEIHLIGGLVKGRAMEMERHVQHKVLAELDGITSMVTVEVDAGRIEMGWSSEMYDRLHAIRQLMTDGGE